MQKKMTHCHNEPKSRLALASCHGTSSNRPGRVTTKTSTKGKTHGKHSYHQLHHRGSEEVNERARQDKHSITLHQLNQTNFLMPIRCCQHFLLDSGVIHSTVNVIQ